MYVCAYVQQASSTCSCLHIQIHHAVVLPGIQDRLVIGFCICCCFLRTFKCSLVNKDKCVVAGWWMMASEDIALCCQFSLCLAVIVHYISVNSDCDRGWVVKALESVKQLGFNSAKVWMSYRSKLCQCFRNPPALKEDVCQLLNVEIMMLKGILPFSDKYLCK